MVSADSNVLDADRDLDPSLELVSARFADLIAQDLQHKLLDQAAVALLETRTEGEFAHALLSFMRRHSGAKQLLYLSPTTPDHFRVLETAGFPGELKQTPALPLSLQPSETGLLSAPSLSSLRAGLLGSLPMAACLVLRPETGDSALITMDSEPKNHLMREFVKRLAERASHGLELLRARLAIEKLSADLTHQSQKVEVQSRVLSMMEDWSGVLNLLEDRYRQLEELLATMVKTLAADKGSLMLYDDARGELIVRAVHGIESDVAARIRRGDEPCRRLRLGEGVAGKVAQTLVPLIVNQVDKEPVFLEPELSRVSSIMCLPLHCHGLVLGVINLTHKTPGKRFSAPQLEEGLKLAGQAAQAINNSRLYHLAVLEPHTEVYTRGHLYHRIQDEIKRARRYQRSLSLLAVSFERFGPLRRELGHTQVNELEGHAADLLRKCVRETDVLARLGENNFAILLPETDSLGAMFLAERIHQEAEQHPSFSPLKIAAHVGVCSFPDRADTLQKLIGRAEAAMTAASTCPRGIPVYLSQAASAATERAS